MSVQESINEVYQSFLLIGDCLRKFKSRRLINTPPRVLPPPSGCRCSSPCSLFHFLLCRKFHIQFCFKLRKASQKLKFGDTPDAIRVNAYAYSTSLFNANPKVANSYNRYCSGNKLPKPSMSICILRTSTTNHNAILVCYT